MTEIKEIFTKKEKQRFFRFPIDLYRDCEYYVPALIGDEMDTFNPKKNGAYSYAESRLWLAYRKGKIVGRIGAILNHAANKKDNVKQLRFPVLILSMTLRSLRCCSIQPLHGQESWV